MTDTATVKVSAETHQTLKAMAKQRGTTMQDLMETIVKDMWKRDFLDAVNAAYAEHEGDPGISAERELWDQTLMDGLAGL